MSGLPDPAAAIAHGPEARFVDEVIELGEDSIVCRGRIPGHSPAVEGGRAPTWAALELAAQAGALLQAATARGAGGRPVGGYLVRARGVRLARATVPAGRELLARVERVGGAGSLTLFDAEVELYGEVVLTAAFGTFSL